MVFRPKKLSFMMTEGLFLGHEVSAAGLGLDKDTIHAIVALRLPCDTRELRSCVDLIYVKSYAAIAVLLSWVLNMCESWNIKI